MIQIANKVNLIAATLKISISYSSILDGLRPGAEVRLGGARLKQ